LEGNRRAMNLLPYHNIAENKHVKLGDSNQFAEFKTPTENEITTIISQFKNHGITATVGG